MGARLCSSVYVLPVLTLSMVGQSGVFATEATETTKAEIFCDPSKKVCNPAIE